MDYTIDCGDSSVTENMFLYVLKLTGLILFPIVLYALFSLATKFCFDEGIEHTFWKYLFLVLITGAAGLILGFISGLYLFSDENKLFKILSICVFVFTIILLAIYPSMLSLNNGVKLFKNGFGTIIGDIKSLFNNWDTIGSFSKFSAVTEAMVDVALGYALFIVAIVIALKIVHKIKN